MLIVPPILAVSAEHRDTPAAVLHFSGDKRNVLPWIGAAFILYLIAVIITIAVNVPLNDTLKAAGDPAHIGDLTAVRRQFDEARWSAWNHADHHRRVRLPHRGGNDAPGRALG